ncbi:hypothetical protein FQA47_007422 [Oryzias melastigma]|uniref:Uncharacterized protein n=1 Tax=Oryzias melastigma TaxID=30732 RepID=A0A834CLX3_ORYME|nr:hypothetical protein FQA47_007422 [Oryzias melastigma]
MQPSAFLACSISHPSTSLSRTDASFAGSYSAAQPMRGAACVPGQRADSIAPDNRNLLCTEEDCQWWTSDCQVTSPFWRFSMVDPHKDTQEA